MIDKRKWDALRNRLAAKHPHVAVGVLASKGGSAEHSPGVTVAQLAAIHEFGAPAAGIPERSFIRRTFGHNKQLPAVTAKLVRKVVAGELTTQQALALLGEWGAAAVKHTITSGAGVPPPLAASTIKAKGSSRPLVDTGRLVNSITYEVREGES